MARIDTVKIKDEGDDFIKINKDDFDASIHVLFDEEPNSDIDMTIEEAIGQLTIGDDNDFTSAGNPRVARVEEILGYDVTSDGVKAVWDSIKEEA